MSRHMFWRLQGKLAVPTDELTWSKTFLKDRVVGQDHIGGVYISTVFLGIDTNIFSEEPLIFELMVFRGGESSEMERYSSWQEAEEAHAKMVAKIKAEIKERIND